MPPQQPSTDGIPGTSEVPFFSSLHGRERRALRGIARIDLQSAVKYGKKQAASPNRATGARRWKYTHANIVYITDETSTKEVTCYAQSNAIPRADLTLEHVQDHEAAKNRLRMDPSSCTSHTVIVVDQSGSMRTCDVMDFRNRSMAVFGMLALDFVAKQRLSGEATDRDAVSLVLMRDSAEVAFEREPMGLVLYNKFVDLHDDSKPRSHGMFLPALNEAQRLLKSQVHGGCALSLMFLSDGRPSDHRAGIRVITERMRSLAEVYGQQLSVTTLGFAECDQDFAVLEAMAGAAQAVGALGEFYRPELSAEGLGTAIASSISSLTVAKSKMTSLTAKDGQPRELRRVEREVAGSEWGHAPTTIETDGWLVYTEEVRRYEFSYKGMSYSKYPWVLAKPFSGEATAVAIRKKALGEGSERLVFGLQEVSSRTGEFVGPKLVAKESKHVGDEYMKMEFQGSFAKTQLTSKLLASKFNEMVRERTSVLGLPTTLVWDVSFIHCSVYQFLDGSLVRGVLVEKMLEPAGRYTKWNGNDGYVRGVLGSPATTPLEKIARQARAEGIMESIMEGDEEDDSTSSVDGNNEDGKKVQANSKAVGANTPTAGTGETPMGCLAAVLDAGVRARTATTTATTSGVATATCPGVAAATASALAFPAPASRGLSRSGSWPFPDTFWTSHSGGRFLPGGGGLVPVQTSMLGACAPAATSTDTASTTTTTTERQGAAASERRVGYTIQPHFMNASDDVPAPAPVTSETLSGDCGAAEFGARSPADAGFSSRKRPAPSATVSGGDRGSGARTQRNADPHDLPSQYFAPKAECYPQAFSHFSYWQTRRKMLVCDLQGVLSSSGPGENRAGVFELTDPVIHYRSRSGRTHVYGKTDFGKTGMNKFFETHRCNDVCRLLGFGE